MSNLSSLYKARLIASLVTLVVLGRLIYEILSGQVNLASMVMTPLVLASMVWLWLTLRKVKRELQRSIDMCHAGSDGDFDRRLVPIREKGDLGDLMYAVNDLIDRTDAFVRESSASMKAVSEGKYHRRIVETGLRGDFMTAATSINAATVSMAARNKQFGEIADELDGAMSGVVETVNGATEDLKILGHGMEATTRATGEQSRMVSASATDASANVQTVAAAAEELSASIAEINRQASQSATIAGNAVEQAHAANAQVEGLSDAANKIGEVVALITDIADQTNLLALNATIEAARAGEAGKGFAVVASEVKNLATQTARATEEISAHIGGIQGATTDAVSAIKSIGGIIEEINAISAGISEAVEQQGAATQEIARNVEQAARGTSDVSSHISSVTDATAEIDMAAGEVLNASNKLSADVSGQIDNLTEKMDVFLGEVKS